LSGKNVLVVEAWTKLLTHALPLKSTVVKFWFLPLASVKQWVELNGIQNTGLRNVPSAAKRLGRYEGKVEMLNPNDGFDALMNPRLAATVMASMLDGIRYEKTRSSMRVSALAGRANTPDVVALPPTRLNTLT